MILKKQDLIQALEIVKPGLAAKEMIEQSTCFAFMEDRVVTYNDEISISHPVKNLAIKGAVKAQELYQFLNKIKKDEIDLVITDNEIQIKVGKEMVGLTLEEEIKLPLEEVDVSGKWKELPKQFKEAMNLTSLTCSSDMSMPVLTCINVGSTEKNKVSSCDNHRLTHFTMGEDIPVRSFLLPAASAKELNKYDLTHISKSTKGWVHFKTKEETIISCRIYEDNYPDISMLSQIENGKKIKFPKSLGEILERANIFAKVENSSLIDISITDDKLKIMAKGDGSGWFKTEVNMQYSGDPFSFQINAMFLKEICDKVQTCIISENKMKFQGDNWEHVLCLQATVGDE